MILQLVSTKYIPILSYGLEVLPIRQSQLRSLDFMINGLFIKLFKTNDIRQVHLRQDLFHFHLPSVFLQQRTKKNSWTKYKVNLYSMNVSCMLSYLCFLPLVNFISLFLFWLPLYGEIKIFKMVHRSPFLDHTFGDL